MVGKEDGMRSGPLQKYRIIDMTTVISGPYCAQLLADQGADVIKVETPDGDLTRHTTPSRNGLSSAFIYNNRNKRSIDLDIKSNEDQEVLKKLISTADVFIQNFRPGVIERIGFGEEAVRKINPDIIFVSISGYGETGPYSDKRVYDHLIQAISGLMSVQGHGKTPVGMNTVIPDKLTALTAAQAITAALLARENTGKGDHVKLAMMDTTIGWMFPDIMLNKCFIGEELPLRYLTPLIAQTSDGYLALQITSDAEWQGFLEAAERTDLVEDQRFTHVADRMNNARAFTDIIHESIIHDNTNGWLKKLERYQVPCAPINTVEQMLVDPQVKHNQLIEEFDHPIAGKIRQPRNAAQFATHTCDNRRPAPALGEHREEIIAELASKHSEV